MDREISGDMIALQNKLVQLKDFIKRNPHFGPEAKEFTAEAYQNQKIEEVHKLEKQSIRAIFKLIEQLVEGISFVMFLVDNNLKELLEQ